MEYKDEKEDRDGEEDEQDVSGEDDDISEPAVKQQIPLFKRALIGRDDG